MRYFVFICNDDKFVYIIRLVKYRINTVMRKNNVSTVLYFYVTCKYKRFICKTVYPRVNDKTDPLHWSSFSENIIIILVWIASWAKSK